MANQVGTGYIDIRGNFSPFDRQMGRFSVTSRSRFAKVGKVAAAGMAAGFGVGAVVLKKSLGEWQEAEKVGKQTGAVLKSTGGVARVTAGDISKLAGAISRKAGIDDEAIQSGENLLLTFTRIRNEQGKGNKVFDQATKAVVDMSVAMNQDLKSSAVQVGKALNDPVKGMTALQRVGVTFDQQQKDRVAQWVKEGHQVRAQKLILRELSKEFGGSAAAQATGLDKAKVSVDNLAESLGTALGPEIEKGAGKTAKFINQMQSGKGAGGEFADELRDIGDAVLPVAKSFGNAALDVGKFAAEHKNITKLATAVGLTAVAFNKLHIPGALRGVKATTGVVGALTGRGGLAGGIASKAAPIPVFVTNPGFAGGGGRGPGAVAGPGSRAVVRSAPRTPFEKLPAGVRGAVGSTAVGLGALKITTDFFKDHSDLGLLDQFADKLERVAKTGDAPGMRALAKELRDTADANGDLTKGTHLKAFADELDLTAAAGGKDLRGLTRLFNNLPKTTGSSLGKVGSHLRTYGHDSDRGSSKTAGLGTTMQKAGDKAVRAAFRVGALSDKIRGLPARKDVALNVNVRAQIAQGVANLPLIDDRTAQQLFGVPRRTGGMVPAMLSPGEVGITPSGASFKVPGARVAADNFPALVPQDTAILTNSGQGIFRRTGSLLTALFNQAPHFQGGGIASTGDWARAMLDKLSIRRSATAIYDLKQWEAIEGGHWKNLAKYNPLNTTKDEPGAKSINPVGVKAYRSWGQGLKATDETLHGGPYGRILGALRGGTFDQFRSAVLASPWGTTAMPGGPGPKPGTGIEGPGGTRVTPAPLTHPILSTQLRPLIDDALAGGVQAGIDRTGHAGRVDLLQSVLEGIVPESTDRATRERITRRGSGGASGPIAARVQAGVAWAKGIASKHMPYQYAGGHGTAGVGNPSFDCSGYSSGIAHAMGLLTSPLDTTHFASWGLPGKGKNVTFGIRGGAGKAGHMMAQVGGHYFESGGGHGPAEVSGWDGAFTTWRHPGWRKGGIVGMRSGGMLPPSPEGKRHLEQLAHRRGVSVAELQNPKSKHFVGWGLRRGGMAVGPNFDFDAWLRRFRKRHHRPPSLNELTSLLGADQLGTQNADSATRVLARRVQGRSVGALVRAEQRIKSQIRRMARGRFTGPERIRTRRLRGALSLIQDEEGRPIGRAIGGAQRTLEAQSGDLTDFQNRQIISGIDPESAQGLSARRDFEAGQFGALLAKRRSLETALKRARRTPGKADDRLVRDQIKQTDSALLALGADIKNLDGTMKEANDAQLAAAIEAHTAAIKEDTASRNRAVALAQVQGPSIAAALIGLANGQIGGPAARARSFPGTPGLGGLSNL